MSTPHSLAETEDVQRAADEIAGILREELSNRDRCTVTTTGTAVRLLEVERIAHRLRVSLGY